MTDDLKKRLERRDKKCLERKNNAPSPSEKRSKNLRKKLRNRK